MALKGHLIAGQLVGPLAGIESGSANDIAGFDGSSNAVSRSLSATLDAVIGNTKGTIIKRGASAWEKLDPADGYLNSASGVLSWAALPPSTGRLVAGTALVKNPIVSGSLTTQAHGLGGTPNFFRFQMECLTSDLGYSVGDILQSGGFFVNVVVFSDATNTNLLINTSTFFIPTKDTYIITAITTSRWKMTVTPYKLT